MGKKARRPEDRPTARAVRSERKCRVVGGGVRDGGELSHGRVVERKGGRTEGEREGKREGGKRK
jgi:hypothetical protein